MKRLPSTLIIALSLLLAAPASQSECLPPMIGAPCAQGGIAQASQSEPSITLGAGNPVHLVTGNKYQRDIDLPANPVAPGLELIRHYNALDSRPSVLGRGWTLSYDTQLFRVQSGWQIVQADGSRVSFPDDSVHTDGTLHTRHGRLDHGHNYHNWFWASGTTLRFNQHGRLIAIRWPSGESVFIQRHSEEGPLNGTIQSVQNERGHALAFHYDVTSTLARLTAIDTPLGRFDYHYDLPHSDLGAPPPDTPSPHRLRQVSRPDGMQRHYLHEPALQAGHVYALTGIVISSTSGSDRQRTSTWVYDAQGRTIRSIEGAPESTQGLLQFDYQRTPSAAKTGLTVVHNENQQATHFHTALKGSRYVLTAVQGAGCRGCAAPGTLADYDQDGRLTNINGTRIQRSLSGSIQAIRPAQSGWPDLTLHYNSQGMRHQWHSSVTGNEHIRYSAQGLPVQRRFANGDTTDIDYDIQNRPIALHEKHGNKHSTTRLDWHGHHLVRIEHPFETETRHHDKQGRITQREIRRNTLPAQHALHITEQFEYDASHRLIRHDLPEGGSLHYIWGLGPQIQAIYWHDIHGERHKIIDTVSGQPGYITGNGLHLDTAAGSDHLTRQLRLRYQDQVIWAQELRYDLRQRITSETSHTRSHSPDRPDISAAAYAYDDHSRLIGYRSRTSHATSSPTTWLAWNADGSAAARRTSTHTFHPAMRRDASGLVIQADGYDLGYSASRRLESITRNGDLIARYHHNAFGYRISRKNAQGQHHHYLYLNNQLVAQADLAQPDRSHTSAGTGITRRYVYAHHVPVAIINYSALKPHGQYFAVHADLQGTPRLITDPDRRIRWHADYTALGQAQIRVSDIQFDLRMPGQIEDPDTGWHDNLLRTYLPQWGQYLEPDPLGPVPGNQAYGYAAQQPRRHTDPMGLLLFSFDGTRHSADTQSNVWKMSQYYLDGPVHYHTGPGNSMFIDWDAITAHQASQIIDTQWKWLLFELSRPHAATDVTPIDILGFSRGAALARHFGNLISQHVDQGLFQFNDSFYGAISVCVDLRFMGLFDTVTQFGLAGTQNRNYDLSIAAAWEWVAHAVALHERRWLFPLTSAAGNGANNVVEAPFIGAHADIGGGVLPENRDKEGGRGDLSNVALNWMLWQARAASVPFDTQQDGHTTVTEPIVHDFRSPALRTVQDGDRSLDTEDGRSWLNYQDDHPRLGRTTREQTETLITRHENWRSQVGVEVGIVDMDGYAQWLYDELGWYALPV